MQGSTGGFNNKQQQQQAATKPATQQLTCSWPCCKTASLAAAPDAWMQSCGACLQFIRPGQQHVSCARSFKMVTGSMCTSSLLPKTFGMRASHGKQQGNVCCIIHRMCFRLGCISNHEPAVELLLLGQTGTPRAAFCRCLHAGSCLPLLQHHAALFCS